MSQGDPKATYGDEVYGRQGYRISAFGVPRFDGGCLFFYFTMLTISVN